MVGQSLYEQWHGIQGQINTLALHTQCQNEFYGGWQLNYYCQQWQAGQANERSTSLDECANNRKNVSFCNCKDS